MEYSNRLNKLNLQSLEYRRLVADLILTYKVIFRLVDIDPNDYFCLKCSDFVYVVIRIKLPLITVGLVCVETFLASVLL